MSFKTKDHYYKKARKEKYNARSVYKLEEIDKHFKLIKKGQNLLDLGYFPGSWSQYCAKKVGRQGKVLALDLQGPQENLQSFQQVEMKRMDVFEFQTDQLFDGILSDMAPQTTGIKSVDQAKSLELVEKVFNLSKDLLKPEGFIIVKVFDSQEAQSFIKDQKRKFLSFKLFKPKSTRSVSKEFFVIANNLKGSKSKNELSI